MEVKTESKTTIETTAYVHDKMLKTYPCDLDGWYGNETCKRVDINSTLEDIILPNGEYKITITLEKIG